MPLSDEEQKILQEIEANLSASDPRLAQQVSETTLYRHATRAIKWAVLGLVAGLIFLVLTFTIHVALGVVGFGIMLLSALVIERNIRKMGKAGFESLTSTVGGGALKGRLGEAGRRWRERWRRDEGS